MIESQIILYLTQKRIIRKELDVTDKLLELIKEYKRFLANEIQYFVNDKTLILLNHKTGRPYSDDVLQKDFYKYCDKANVPRIRSYDLRHNTLQL